MSTFTSILSGVAGLATIAGATPATAQYAPNGGYNNGYNNGGYNNGGVVGAVINSVLGGGRYGAYGQGADRNAVEQCARAAESRLTREYRATGYGNRAPGYNQNGYNHMAAARVVGITGVERRSNGLKVSGLIDSGSGFHRGQYDQRYSNQGYGNSNHGNGAQAADMRFSCKVDFRGYVSSVKFDRIAYRAG